MLSQAEALLKHPWITGETAPETPLETTVGLGTDGSMAEHTAAMSHYKDLLTKMRRPDPMTALSGSCLTQDSFGMGLKSIPLPVMPPVFTCSNSDACTVLSWTFACLWVDMTSRCFSSFSVCLCLCPCMCLCLSVSVSFALVFSLLFSCYSLAISFLLLPPRCSHALSFPAAQPHSTLTSSQPTAIVPAHCHRPSPLPSSLPASVVIARFRRHSPLTSSQPAYIVSIDNFTTEASSVLVHVRTHVRSKNGITFDHLE
jgi:hypothetical protein